MNHLTKKTVPELLLLASVTSLTFGSIYVGHKVYVKCNNHSQQLVDICSTPQKNKNTHYNAFMYSLVYNKDTFEIMKEASIVPLTFWGFAMVLISFGTTPIGPILGIMYGVNCAEAISLSTTWTNHTIDKYKYYSHNIYRIRNNELPGYITYLNQLK